MFALLLLFVLAIGSQAQNPCCYPPQWEVQKDILTASLSPGTEEVRQGIKTTVWDSYDYTNQRFMTNITMLDDQHQPYRATVIYDYKKNLAYFLKDNTCSSIRITGEFPRSCIPDNATFTGTSYLGSGSKTLEYNSFSFQMNNLSVFRTVTKDGCLPVSQTAIGDIGTSQEIKLPGVIHVTYSGITTGIRDEKVFDPPEKCLHVNGTSVEPNASIGTVLIGR